MRAVPASAWRTDTSTDCPPYFTPFEMRLSSTCRSRFLSPLTMHCTPSTSHVSDTPLLCATDAIMFTASLQSSTASIGVNTSVSCPASMRAMSRTSLTSDSRCSADRMIASMCERS